MNDYQASHGGADPIAHQVTAAGGLHSYSHEEVRAFTEYINAQLSGDPDLQGDLPINPDSGDLFRVASKGVLLCKMINLVAQNAIDTRKLASRNPNQFQVTANHNLCIEAARGLGLSTVNIGPGELCS